ncbi:MULTISPECIES: hypothetical protein [Legionella]|uniref:Uncharacterized protein n=1 Tax=Legionella septentrionalis TaxID=2498109 RepID=A0A433JGA1_9GAMM|nr:MULTISPECIES: hypothetical protein [Legionella]MCP0913389.1 hypothetical protein [Legionella sp. 27cVA30]RUQ78848.1 hypothetical protein EKM59_11610 [Legionella septentrionalis]RUQ95112.1 hypothetical protein ELY11_09980 [Legionella septentrionalis]RUR08731.1 hypothetical protein ELY14_10815 [Legionella septentrionalis]
MNLYQEIYAACKDKNSDLLNAMVNRQIELLIQTSLSFNKKLLDAPKPASLHWTAAAQLAYEGDEESLDFLKQYDIEHSQIFRGYAKQKNYAKIAKRSDAELKDWIACGFAEAGDHESVEFYRTHYKSNPSLIACGYVEGGYHSEAEAYIALHHVSPSLLARNHARKGNDEWVKHYENNYANHIFLPHIILGALEGNNFMLAAQYYAKQKISMPELVKLYKQAHPDTSGEEVKEFEELIQRFAHQEHSSKFFHKKTDKKQEVASFHNPSII